MAQQQTNLSTEDWVLALLSVVDQPIYGRLMLVKEVFLIAKEIDPKLDKELDFFPYDLGPYSKVLAQKLNEMVSQGLIEVGSKEGEDGEYVFSLTDKGRTEAQKALAFLRDEVDRTGRADLQGVLQWADTAFRGLL